MIDSLWETECPNMTSHALPNQIVLDRACGNYIYCQKGEKYLDLCAGFGSLSLGHQPDDLKEIFADFLDEKRPAPILQGLGEIFPTSDKILFLQKLTNILPFPKAKGIIALSGSQAIESALKTMILHTGKSGVICLKDCYHGIDIGTLPLTYRESFRTLFDKHILNKNVIHIPEHCSQSVIEEAIADLQARDCGFAGILAEPVQSRVGVKVIDQDWLRLLGETAHKNQGLFVLDEIYTGFGRTGSLTISDHVGADLTCLGKALGGGLPLSVCVGTSQVMDSWPVNKSEAVHGGTFFAHPLSLKLAIKVIERFEESGLHSHIEDTSAWLFDLLYQSQLNYEC